MSMKWSNFPILNNPCHLLTQFQKCFLAILVHWLSRMAHKDPGSPCTLDWPACDHVTMWPCEVRTLLCEIMLGCSRSWLPGLTWLGVLPCNLAGHVNHDIFIMLLRRRPGHYDTRGAMGTRERRGGKRKLKTSVYLLGNVRDAKNDNYTLYRLS